MHRFIIGRDASCDFVLAEPTVSSRHAALEIGADGFVSVDDLASRNGTKVNGRKIEGKTRLSKGDKLKLGTALFDWEAALAGGQNRAANAVLPEAEPPKGKITQSVKRRSYVWLSLTASLVVFLVWVVATPGGRETVGKVVGLDSASRAEKKQVKKKRTYDISCLNEGDETDELIRKGNAIEDKMLDRKDVSISLDQEIKVGDELHQQVLQEYELEKDKKYNRRVEKVFRRLMQHLPDSSRGFNYVTYVLKSEEINAFTAGGKIYITTGILDFTKSDDELACVIGHEIFHNELGHINRHLQKEAVMKKMFGDILGQVVLMAGSIFTASFNQDEEAYCDLHGLDMAEDAGYNGCAISAFWTRMAEKEEDTEAAKFFRTHPYATQRSRCVENHIKNNYQRNCSNPK
jgi:Zn-dependent protease with chaperone function